MWGQESQVLYGIIHKLLADRRRKIFISVTVNDNSYELYKDYLNLSNVRSMQWQSVKQFERLKKSWV